MLRKNAGKHGLLLDRFINSRCIALLICDHMHPTYMLLHKAIICAVLRTSLGVFLSVTMSDRWGSRANHHIAMKDEMKILNQRRLVSLMCRQATCEAVINEISIRSTPSCSQEDVWVICSFGKRPQFLIMILMTYCSSDLTLVDRYPAYLNRMYLRWTRR